jgi:hypothetical protein
VRCDLVERFGIVFEKTNPLPVFGIGCRKVILFG